VSDAICTLLLCLFATAPAWSDPMAAEGSVSASSKYIWRGFNLSDHTVWQPSLTFTKDELSLDVWSSFDAGDANRCTELDYTLTRSFDLGPNEATVGLIYYTFPSADTARSSKEIFAGLTRPGRIPVSLTAYYDYDEGDGLYAEMGASIPVSHRDGETIAIAIGYNLHQWREDTGLSHALLTYSRLVPAGEATLRPEVALSAPLSDDFGTELYFGANTSIPF